MKNYFTNIKNLIITFGISSIFSILKKYASFDIYITNLTNYISNIYYNSQNIKKCIDFVFECHYLISKNIFQKNIEPYYNPWACLYYMSKNKLYNNYYNLNNKKTKLFNYLPIYFDGNITKLNNTNIIKEIMNNIYETCNYFKMSYFDYCDDYLIIIKIKDIYISRIGKYNNIKNLIKENVTLEKNEQSILIAEYCHPDMKDPIILNINKGYFIENNEILSPMFIRRLLMLQNIPYIFDDKYKLRFMDKFIKFHTLDSSSFVLIHKNKFEIIKL